MTDEDVKPSVDEEPDMDIEANKEADTETRDIKKRE